MGVHSSCFLLLLLASIFFGVSPNRQKLLAYFFFVSCLFLFERSFIDPFSIPDLDGYRESFLELSEINILKVDELAAYQLMHKEELGYIFLSKAVGLISTDFTVYLLVISMIWISLYIYVIAKYSQNVFISVVFLFLIVYGQSLFVLRQHLAIPIILLSYNSIINRKLLNFICVTVLAFLFHATAIVWMPVYFLFAIKKPKHFIVVLALTFLILIVAVKFIEVINGVMLLDYSSYISNDEKGNTNNIPLLISTFFMVSYLLILKRRVWNIGINKVLLMSVLLDVMLLTTTNSLTMVTRLVLYFHVSLIFIIPLIVNRIRTKIVSGLFLVISIGIFSYIQFFGSFFVNNLQKVRIGNISVNHILFYVIIIMILMLFLYRNVKPNLCNPKE